MCDAINFGPELSFCFRRRVCVFFFFISLILFQTPVELHFSSIQRTQLRYFDHWPNNIFSIFENQSSTLMQAIYFYVFFFSFHLQQIESKWRCVSWRVKWRKQNERNRNDERRIDKFKSIENGRSSYRSGHSGTHHDVCVLENSLWILMTALQRVGCGARNYTITHIQTHTQQNKKKPFSRQ